MKTYYVYILASQKYGTLYIGFTSDIERRMREHKEKSVKGFTEKYGVEKLVYYEIFDNSFAAFDRERKLKKWNRSWKISLIENNNPEWNDLAADWE